MPNPLRICEVRFGGTRVGKFCAAAVVNATSATQPKSSARKRRVMSIQQYTPGRAVPPGHRADFSSLSMLDQSYARKIIRATCTRRGVVRTSHTMLYCCLVLAILPVAFAAEYRAGVARIDITPAVGHEMGGYSARRHGSTGLHDPLYATVLVIESGDNSIALVTCDLRSFVSTRVGEMARQKFGIRNTLIDVSHTHSGPLTWELRSSWYAEAEDKMIQAIGSAKAA